MAWYRLLLFLLFCLILSACQLPSNHREEARTVAQDSAGGIAIPVDKPTRLSLICHQNQRVEREITFRGMDVSKPDRPVTLDGVKQGIFTQTTQLILEGCSQPFGELFYHPDNTGAAVITVYGMEERPKR